MKKLSKRSVFKVGALLIFLGAAPFIIVLAFTIFTFLGPSIGPSAGGEILFALAVLSYFVLFVSIALGSVLVLSSGYSEYLIGKILLVFSALLVFGPLLYAMI